MTFVVGVAGGSGSGKTTFARALLAALGDERAGILSQDSYYRDLHAYFDRDGGLVNFDHPDSLEFDLLVRHLDQLRKGRGVRVPRYDFATHRRLPDAAEFEPRAVVIVDGILILTEPSLRERLDLSVFISAPEDVRFARRLRRDVAERGRTAEGVRDQFSRQVKPMHDLFVEPSRCFADRTLSGENDLSAAARALAMEILARPGPKS